MGLYKIIAKKSIFLSPDNAAEKKIKDPRKIKLKVVYKIPLSKFLNIKEIITQVNES